MPDTCAAQNRCHQFRTFSQDESFRTAASDPATRADTARNVQGVVGSAFADRLIGRAQGTSIDGGPGDDRIIGLRGNDTLNGGFGNDVIIARGGNNLINGGPGDDRITAGAGNDVIRGGIGDTVIEGGPGNDRLIGGPGRDTFVFRPGFGEDRILDFNPRADWLDFSQHGGVVRLSDLTLRQAGGNTIIDDGMGSRVVLAGVELDALGDGAFVF